VPLDFDTVLTIGIIVGGIAYAIGQIITSRRKGQSDALSIALQEVEAIRIKADRLDRELVAVQAEVHALQKENATLRDLISTRSDLDARLISKLEEALDKQTKRLVTVMREGRADA